MNALIWLVDGAGTRLIAVERRNSRSCAEPQGSDGSRAANPYDAPREDGRFHSKGREKSQRPGGSAGPRPGRVSGDGLPRGNVPGHHAAGADHRAVADGDAGQDDRTAADPDIAADAHGTAKLEPGTPRVGITRMVRSINLHGGADLGTIADRHLDDVKDDAIEVEEDAVAEADVVAIVAMKWRPDHGIDADMSKTLAQQRMAHRYGLRQRGVISNEPGFGCGLVSAEFGIGAIQFARQHLLLLGLQPIDPSCG